MTTRTVALLVASLRTGSINQRLARAVARYAPENLTFEQIAMHELPFYNGDLEGKRPSSVDAFTDAIRAHDAVCCVTPEYNRSIPGMLKNAIDWGSKPMGHNVWSGKVLAMTGASMGGIGTAVAQQHLRQVLSILHCIVMPGETYITFKTPDMIADDGTISDESVRDFITAFGKRFARLIDKMAD